MSSSGDQKKREVPAGLKKVLEWDKKVTKSAFDFFNAKYGQEHRPTLKALEYSCHGIPWIAGTIGMLYLAPAQIQLWMNLLILLIVDIVIVACLKAFSRRRRPAYNHDDMVATVSVDKFSFPSGHSTRAVGVALFFCGLYPLHFVIRSFLMVWSLAVCVSRVFLGRHHILDVVAGFLVGIVEYLILNVIWISEEGAQGIGEQLFGEDPWSNA